MHYPWGMLVQSVNKPRPNNRPSYTIYDAVVLEQVLIDIARDYRDSSKDPFTKLSLFSISDQTKKAEVQQQVNRSTGGARPPN